MLPNSLQGLPNQSSAGSGFLRSVFLLDKRYSCISVIGSCDQTRNRLHIYRRACCATASAAPDTERCGSRPACSGRDSVTKQGFAAAPLGRTPFRSRGHKPIVCHKGKPKFAHRRSDLLTASSDSRLARSEQQILVGPARWRDPGQPLTLNLRGREKVNAQWPLFCMVHNIEKRANSGWRQ